MSRSYPTSFPTRTVVSRPCVFGSDKKSVFSSHKSSTCAHSSSIPTTAAAGQKASGASVETRPYLKQKRKSYKRGDPVATWVPFVQTSVDSQQFGSSTANPSDFRSTEEGFNDQQSRSDKTFTVRNDKYSVSEKCTDEPVRIPDNQFDFGEFLLIHNDLSSGSHLTKNVSKSVGIQVHSYTCQSEDTLTNVQTSIMGTQESGTNIQNDSQLADIYKPTSPHIQSNAAEANSSLRSVVRQADKDLYDLKCTTTDVSKETNEIITKGSSSKTWGKKCSHKSKGIVVIREELQIVEPRVPKIKRKRRVKKRPARLIATKMNEDGVSPKPLRVYINDKGMTVKVVAFEDNSPPKDRRTPKNIKTVNDKQAQPLCNDDIAKGNTGDDATPKRGRECKYDRKEIREYIREKRKQRQAVQKEEKHLQSTDQSRSPPNYDREAMKEYIEKRRKLRQIKAAEEERLKKETVEMKKTKLQQLEETAKQLVKKCAKKFTDEEKPVWKGPLEEDTADDVEEDFVPKVPEFKENIPALKREKSCTKPGYVVKPVSSQPDARRNLHKNTNLKAKSDEEVRKTHKKEKDKIAYEIAVGGKGDIENAKDKITANVGDSKHSIHIGKKSSVLKSHGNLSEKQVPTVVSNKITEDPQVPKMSADQTSLLKQIHNLKNTRKRNFRQPENDISGVLEMSHSRTLAQSKEINDQQSIQSISPHKKKTKTSVFKTSSNKEAENIENKVSDALNKKEEADRLTPEWLKSFANQPDPFNFINVIKMKKAAYEKSKNQHLKDKLKGNEQVQQQLKDKKTPITIPESDDTDAPSIVSSVENNFKPYHEPLTMADLKLDLPSSINSEKSSETMNEKKATLIPTGIVKSPLSGNIKSMVSSMMSEAPLTLPESVQSLALQSKYSGNSSSSNTKAPSSESKLELVSEQYSEVKSLEVPQSKLVSKTQGSEENTSSSEFLSKHNKSHRTNSKHRKHKSIRTSTPTPVVQDDVKIPQGNFDSGKVFTSEALHLKFQAELSKLDAFDHTLYQILEAEKQHAIALSKPLPQIVPKIFMSKKISAPENVTNTGHRNKSKSSTEQIYNQDAKTTSLIPEKVSSKSQPSDTSASEIRTYSYVRSAPPSSVSDKTSQNVSSVNTARDESNMNSVISTASVLTEEASCIKSATSRITTAVDSSLNQTHVSSALDNTIPKYEPLHLDKSITGLNLSKTLFAESAKSPNKGERLTLKLCQDLITEEDYRAAQHEALFKMRGRTIKANFREEIKELQIQKEELQNSKESATIDKVKALKKKQRAVVLKYQQEMNVLKRLREKELATSQDRKKFLLNILHQHQDKVSQMALTVGSALGIESINSSPKKSVPAKGTSVISLPDNSSGADISSSFNQLDEQIRHLSEKEKKLARRKNLIQELFAKHAKLNEEEHKIKELEKKFAYGIKPKIDSTVTKPEEKKWAKLLSSFSKDSLQDVSEQLVSPTRHHSITETISTQSVTSTSVIRSEDVVASKPLCSNSKESVHEVSEHLMTSGSVILTQSVPEETDKISDTRVKLNRTSAKTGLERESSSSGSRVVDKYNSESFESPVSSEPAKSKKPSTVVLRSNNTSFVQERPSSSGRKPSIVVIKGPLSPQLHKKSQLRYSSGSEDSILFSQNETSEQSDVEVRIAALKEQLKQRKLEAERLQREQKRARREKLKSKELSLVNQIQAYDSYINQLKKDLEQQEKDTSTTPVIRPLIKQPRAAEKVPVKKSQHTVVDVVSNLTKKKLGTSDDEQSSIKSVSEASSVETTIQSPGQVQEVKSIEESQDVISTEMKSENRTDGYVSEDIEEALSQVANDNIEEVTKSGDVDGTENDIVSETIHKSEESDILNIVITNSNEILSEVTNEKEDETIEECAQQAEDQTSVSVISTDASSIRKSPQSEEWTDGAKFFENYRGSYDFSHIFDSMFVSSRKKTHDQSESQSVVSQEECPSEDVDPTETKSVENEISVVTEDVSPRDQSEMSVVEQLHEENKVDSNQESIHSTTVLEEEQECKTTSEDVDVPEEAFPLPVFSAESNETPSSEGDVETEHNSGNFIGIHSRSPSQRSTNTIRVEIDHEKETFDNNAQTVVTVEEIETRNVDENIIGSTTTSLETDIKELPSEKSSPSNSEATTPKTETLVSDKDRSLHSILLSDENYEKSSIAISSNDESYESDESLSVDMIKVFMKDKSVTGMDKDGIGEECGEPDNVDLNETCIVETHDAEQVPDKRKTIQDEKVDKITDAILKQLLSESMAFDNHSLHKGKLSDDNKEEVIDEDISETVSEKSSPSKEVAEPPSVLSVLADSFLNVFVHSATNDILKIYRRKKQTPSETSDVRKRVQEIMNDSLSSPRSTTSRPQDYMVTTYDVLSPEPSDSSVPSEPERDSASGTPETDEPQEKSDKVDINVGVGVVNGGTNGADNEGFWFDEDVGLGRTRREAEELRLQQLQIEQEIQQLEQAQEQIPSYYYVREIPNKPPPPYTPPGEASRSPKVRPRLSDSIPSQQNEIDTLIVTASQHIFTALTKGEDILSVQPPDKFLTREGSGRVYNKFLFDLVRQLICEATESDNEDDLLPWDKTGYKRKRCVIPRTQDVICENVGKQIKILFGFEPRNIKENLIIRWSRKKRDHVDELLVRELHEEESEWTDYKKDEIAVKNQLTVEICNSLIADTSAALFSAFQKKIRYSQQT